MAINYYLLLGIPPDADQQRIKASYRSLAKRFHPDANRGSESAAELFRQINEAYRVLSDAGTREKYDQTLPPQQSPPDKPENSGSEEKFSKFLNSLLDAIFGSIEPPPPRPVAQSRVPPKPKQPVRKASKPDFNFYFHLAVEKQASPYQRGNDGIYRESPKPAKTNVASSGFNRVQRGSVLTILLTVLFNVL